jgi:hypothetical protein
MELHISRFSTSGVRLHGVEVPLRTGFDTTFESAHYAIEVLQEIRRLREDLILLAITESTSNELPLQATQAGADHFFLKPVDGEQLRVPYESTSSVAVGSCSRSTATMGSPERVRTGPL